MADALQQRIAELQAMDWRGIKAAAIAAGFDDKPDDDLSWEDNAPAIAQRELELGRLTVDEPELAPEPAPAVVPQPAPVMVGESLPPKVRGIYNTALYEARGIPVCPLCGEKELTDSNNKPICPERFTSSQCPRLED